MPWPFSRSKPSPEATIRALREQALGRTPAELGLAPTAELPKVFGLLMETGHQGAAASLVAFAEGSVSLYFSNGGGFIGAGQHPPVRAAAMQFLAEAERHLAQFTPAARTPLPTIGQVCFYLRTYQGTFAAEALEQTLGAKRHPLWPLFYRGHAVITAIREQTEGPAPKGPAH